MNYEFVPGDEKPIGRGRTVKRIRAIVAIAAIGVAPGDLGGYIEKPENLHGNAWVYGDARVSGNARVYGDARVYGNAQVYGDAQVYGSVSIFWASKVGTDNGTLTVMVGKSGPIVTRGCFVGTPEQFLAQSKEVHDEQTHHEYKLLIEVGLSRISRAAKLEKS